MVVDISPVTSFLPIAGFLIITIIVFAVLHKTKLFENALVNVFISLLVATFFISASGAVDYIKNIVPWFAVLIVSFVFIMAVILFVGKDMGSWGKGIGIVFVILMLVIFVASAVVVYSEQVIPYFENFSEGRWFGTIILIIISAIVSWVLVKK